MYMLVLVAIVWQNQWIYPIQLSRTSREVTCGIINTSFKLCGSYFFMILRLDICSHFNLLLGLRLIENDLGIISGQVKCIFIWTARRIITTPEFENQKVRVQSYRFCCSHLK